MGNPDQVAGFGVILVLDVLAGPGGDDHDALGRVVHDADVLGDCSACTGLRADEEDQIARLCLAE